MQSPETRTGGSRPKVAFALRSKELLGQVFPRQLLRELGMHADVIDMEPLTEFTSERSRETLSQTDALITGWGAPTINAQVLDGAPHLKLIAHSAGTVKQHVDPVCWQRGIAVTTAANANGVPVAEYTLAFILLAGKRVFPAIQSYRTAQGEMSPFALPNLGNHGSVVGIIGASRIGRMVLERLKTFDHEVLLADPTITAGEAADLGAKLVDLDELMAFADVVSLHAPLLPSTIGMIGSSQMKLMKNGATFINTSRGSLVDHQALRVELASGRVNAVLDVTDTEPLNSGDSLYGMDNVVLTPHVAGSLGNELPRMGRAAVEEVARLATGRPYKYPVSPQSLKVMA